MNHADAAELRDALNEKDFVEDPHDGDSKTFSLVRVSQPGYLNGEPMYEVLVDVDGAESLHLPSEFLQLVAARDGYLRVQDGTIHVRDWRAGEVDDGE